MTDTEKKCYARALIDTFIDKGLSEDDYAWSVDVGEMSLDCSFYNVLKGVANDSRLERIKGVIILNRDDSETVEKEVKDMIEFIKNFEE
jgi:hypothetical protein